MNRAVRAKWVAAAFVLLGALEGVVEAQDDTAAAVVGAYATGREL